MPGPDKIEKVKEIKKRFDSSSATIVTEYRGLPVDQMAELRRSLRPLEIDYKVLKNTLVRIALEGSPSEPILPLIEGPIAVAFVRGDVVKAAQALVRFARKNPALKVKGGLVEGRLLNAAEVRTIATLPSREVLLGRIVGALKSPLSRLIGVVAGPPRGLVYTLRAIKEQREKAA
jgi:large subunit ribosomal protein L10